MTTLKQAIENYIKDEQDGDYYNTVEIFINGILTYKGHSLKEAKEACHSLLHNEVNRYYWHDTDIAFFIGEDEEEEYSLSASAGDYGPSNPWDAPGMSIRDFI